MSSPSLSLLPPTPSVSHIRLAPQQTDQPMKNKSNQVVYINDNMACAVPQIGGGGGASDTNGKKSAKIEVLSSSPVLAAGSRVSMQQLDLGSVVPPPAVARYHVRDAAQCGKILLSHNEHLPSAFSDGQAGKDHVPMEVNVTCIDQQARLALLARYEQQMATEWAAPGFSTIEAPPPTHVFSEDFRFMRQDLSAAAVSMSNRIQYLAHEIAALNGLDVAEFTSVSDPARTGVLTYGRIVSGSMDGRLNVDTVMLEGDDNISHGHRVCLDLTGVESFALFPGLVCVVRGRNDTGQRLVVQQLFTNAHLAPAASTAEQMRQARPLTIMYAAGPFHLCPPAPAASTRISKAAQPRSLELEFTPLVDLIEHAKQCSPDVLILSGPFIDAEADIVRCGAITENFCLRSGRNDELIASLLVHIQAALGGTTTRVVVVPNTRDLPLDPVFPQPPLPTGLVSDLDVTLAPNPCTLRVNNCVIGVCAEDVMLDLAQNLYIKNVRDRVSPAYLFEQQSFYPKYPSDTHVPFDFTYSAGLCMHDDHRPDILFSPSSLGRSVKTYDEQSLCINPGRLVMSDAAGTFAFLTIQPLDVQKLDADAVDASASFVDYLTQKRMYCHQLAARTRVDIVRI